MWNRLFKSKTSKDSVGKKRKFSNILKKSSSANKTSTSIKKLKVLSDSEDVIDAGPEDSGNLVPCQICARTFAPSTLEKHVSICEKMNIQKRTPFDSFRQRREGTDLETYLPSNYGHISKPKTSKITTNDSKSTSKLILSVHDRNTPTKEGKMVSKNGIMEAPLRNRSLTKRNWESINEVCRYCSRSFGHRAYDRHVEWCREKNRIAAPTLSAQQHLAKERMQARTKYKAPILRSKREKNREKYSSLSESMNNLSYGGGMSIMDFNSVADPYERGRKSSIMSVSMTSSIASECGYSDKYDPFISAKRQLEDLFNPSSNPVTSSIPNKEDRSSSAALTVKLPSSPIKNQNLPRSSFRRTSSLRMPKKTSSISYMPKYKPLIQRGISDEGPISSNFIKPEDYDELPVKNHAIIPPDLVPKSHNPNQNEPPIAFRRYTNSANRWNVDLKSGDFPLTKTDSLAAFLKFEDDLECTPLKDVHLSELKDKNNIMNKKSISEQIDNKINDPNEFGGDRQPAIESPLKQKNNPIKLLPIETPLIQHKIMLEPLIANLPACKNNINHNHNIENSNSIDSNFINSCDNLRIINFSKLTNESSLDFDQSKNVVGESKNNLVTNTNNSMRSSSSAESIDSHQKMEMIVNLKNINDTDKRNPKRQMQLDKNNLLFDNAITIEFTTDSNIDQINKLEDDSNDNNNKNNSALTVSPIKRNLLLKSDNDGDKILAKDVQNIETLFDDFDLEEFISSFSDNEQFPIFKNYKQMVSSSRFSSREKHSSESTSEECDSINHEHFNKLEIEERVELLNGKSLEKPDVTVEADKQMQIESELHKIVQKKHTTDNKLSQLNDILDEKSTMSQVERELLTSLQETLDLTSNVFTPKNDESIGMEATFKSLFLQSPNEKIGNGSIRFNHRSGTQSYQRQEIFGVATNNGNNNDLSCLNVPPKSPLTPTIDRIFHPITTVHKNDSQNICNTINMTSSYTDDQSGTDSMNPSDWKFSSPLSPRESLKLSKFCYECGAKFIVEQAKFCMDCGAKRAILD